MTYRSQQEATIASLQAENEELRKKLEGLDRMQRFELKVAYLIRAVVGVVFLPLLVRYREKFDFLSSIHIVSLVETIGMIVASFIFYSTEHSFYKCVPMIVAVTTFIVIAYISSIIGLINGSFIHKWEVRSRGK